MTLRRQLPGYSPLTLRSVIAGFTAAMGGTPAWADARVTGVLRSHFQSQDVLLTDSGTTALAVAMRGATADRPGVPARVALPAYCCYDLATAADGAAVEVLLYDLDPATLGPDLDSLETCLRGGAGVVVIAHLYGVPVDVRGALELSRRYSAVLIEDAAQGDGTLIADGRPAGSGGPLAVLSFGRGKGRTGGGGGAVLLNDSSAAGSFAQAQRIVRRSQSNGLLAAVALAGQWALGRPTLYGLPSALPFLHLGETIYHRPRPPRGLPVVAGGVLPTTWPLSEKEAEVRRRNAARLQRAAALRSRDWTPIPMPGGVPGYLRLPLVASIAGRRAAEAPAGRALGVAPGYPLALIDLTGFSERVSNRESGCPGARRLAQQLITLPTHSRLTETDLRRLEQWLRG